MGKKQVQIKQQSSNDKKSKEKKLDLRTPSGKPMKY